VGKISWNPSLVAQQLWLPQLRSFSDHKIGKMTMHYKPDTDFVLRWVPESITLGRELFQSPPRQRSVTLFLWIFYSIERNIFMYAMVVLITVLSKQCQYSCIAMTSQWPTQRCSRRTYKLIEQTFGGKVRKSKRLTIHHKSLTLNNLLRAVQRQTIPLFHHA